MSEANEVHKAKLDPKERQVHPVSEARSVLRGKKAIQERKARSDLSALQESMEQIFTNYSPVVQT